MLTPQQQQWAQQLFERKQAFIRAHPELIGKGDAMRQAMDKEFSTGLPQNRPPGQIPTVFNDDSIARRPLPTMGIIAGDSPFSPVQRFGSNTGQQFGQFPPMGLPTPMSQGMPQQFSQEDR